MFNRISLVFAVSMIGTAADSDTIVPDCGLYTYSAHIVRVIDGDTVVADIDLGFNTWRHNEHLRLVGIDAPENSSDAGKVSTDALRVRIENKDLYICTKKTKRSGREATGSFGRYLAEIFDNGESVNQWMVTTGMAVAYDG